MGKTTDGIFDITVMKNLFINYICNGQPYSKRIAMTIIKDQIHEKLGKLLEDKKKK